MAVPIVDHTPTTPADDRPFKILERTPVEQDHKERLFALVRAAQKQAAAEGRELQTEFAKEAVAMIVGCNQFLRLFRGGSNPGVVELLVDDPVKEQLKQAGYTLAEPEGAVFKMFGWVRVNPTEGEPKALPAAVEAAYRKAAA